MAKSFKDIVAAAKSRIREISAADAIERSKSDPNVLILDVREPGEFQAARIPGALNVPRGLLEAKADLEYPQREPALEDRSRPVIVQCASGGRSALAADVLQEMGFTDVASLAGGIGAWKQSGGPLEG